ncbi:VanZ family protein [Peribacillus sp. FSL H8-0477]|uniref:VanZ family protein n=1 Tax=Peribacillus sp. FSL H8-0477 TaxID=2921388 RepID=UPI0030F6D8AF
MVVSVTIFPFPIGFTSNLEDGYRSINLIPLKSIVFNSRQIGTAYAGDVLFMISILIKNVGGNILLFMPLGFLAPLVWSKFRQFKNSMAAGFIGSISIELLQLLEYLFGGMDRITDIDDVIFNVIGCMIGFFIYKMILRVVDTGSPLKRPKGSLTIEEIGELKGSCEKLEDVCVFICE